MTAHTAAGSRTTGVRRRVTVGVAVAGAAALGGLVALPQASAASTAGPDAFVQVDHGRVPVFFCDPANPEQRHQVCLDLDGPRVLG